MGLKLSIVRNNLSQLHKKGLVRDTNIDAGARNGGQGCLNLFYTLLIIEYVVEDQDVDVCYLPRVKRLVTMLWATVSWIISMTSSLIHTARRS